MASVSLGLRDREVIIAVAQTGSGKTAASVPHAILCRQYATDYHDADEEAHAED
jgi:HrpA-like RNA helicase